MNNNSDKFKLDKILEKIPSGIRLEDGDILFLLESRDADALQKIAETANALNKKINLGNVSYVVNRNINFTNICSLNCKFCGYKRTEKSKDAFLLDYDKIIEKISEGERKIGINEICVTGGINPGLKPEYYFNLIKTMRTNFPDLHIHAFSPQEIYWLANATGKSYGDVIEKLVECGINSMPGTAAEILAVETRKKICPQKISAPVWVEIIKTAHNAGIKTSATILFGHIESHSDIVYHLSLLRQIQDETSGFTEFIPLPFISFKTPLKHKVDLTYGQKSDIILKFYAISRLYLDNFKNIQTSWPKIGTGAAVESLELGINDFGGTLMEENITKSAGGSFGEYLSEEQIKKLIAGAGKIPIRRDTLYNYAEFSGNFNNNYNIGFSADNNFKLYESIYKR
ncbi:MAG: 5-amino-6-(D-ribitylamino)uracil--L-tyrosine 4-hydroxyphenyl transferase CofH [bacterium]